LHVWDGPTERWTKLVLSNLGPEMLELNSAKDHLKTALD